MDGPLFSALNKLADLMILNLLFVVCSLPVITLGASLSAMQYVTIKMRDKEEGYVWKSFLKAFRANLKKATLIWLLLLAVLIVLFVDTRLMTVVGGSAVMIGAIRVAVLLGALIWLMVFLYAFPLQARFENTVAGTLQNALLLAIANVPRTFLMMLLIAAAVIATGWSGTTIVYGSLFWLLVGFALICHVNTKIRDAIFRKLMPQSEEASEKESGQTEDAGGETRALGEAEPKAGEEENGADR